MPRRYIPQIKKFGAIVRNQREKAQLTQATLAELCDVDIRTIRRIEKGEFAIGLEIIISLAEVFKMQPAELLDKVKLKHQVRK